ncbi:deaminase [Buttiauxella agrestis]
MSLKRGPGPNQEQILRHLRRSNAVAQRAIALGHHPFGALLVAPDNETVLLEQCNIDTVNHAESTLARVAATNYTAEYLWQCTLYTAVEPCCMCAEPRTGRTSGGWFSACTKANCWRRQAATKKTRR